MALQSGEEPPAPPRADAEQPEGPPPRDLPVLVGAKRREFLLGDSGSLLRAKVNIEAMAVFKTVRKGIGRAHRGEK
jgi:hypothetical protein